MRQAIISLIRKARYTLETQWSIEPEHLRACQSFFSYAEALLNHEDSRFEEEYEEDGDDSCTYSFEYRSSNDHYEFLTHGRYESLSVFLQGRYDSPSLQFSYFEQNYSDRVLRNKKSYRWNAYFDEKKHLYYIGVEAGTSFSSSKLLWAYKYNRRFQ